MKRSFQVATIFTGAATCAALFTPGAAIAATAKTNAIQPDAFKMNCAHTSTTSVHLYRPPSADHGPTCVGEEGKVSLSSAVFQQVCAGNNTGFFVLSGSIEDFRRGGSVFFSRSPGPVTEVMISSFHGDAECPFIPREL